MNDDLDRWVTRLAAAPTDRPLGALEAEIGQAIARRRAERRTAQSLAPVRMAAIGLALAIGVTAGGAAALSALLRPAPNLVLAGAAPLAPSTLLLDGRR